MLALFQPGHRAAHGHAGGLGRYSGGCGAGAGGGRQPGQRLRWRVDHHASNVQTRQVPLGNLFFKIIGVIIDPAHRAVAAACAPLCSRQRRRWWCCSTWPSTRWWGCLHRAHRHGGACRAAPAAGGNPGAGRSGSRPQHLDPSALATPSLAISCARAKPAPGRCGGIHAAGVAPVIRTDDQQLAKTLRKLDDEVDGHHTRPSSTT